jgi:hypothetical protein
LSVSACLELVTSACLERVMVKIASFSSFSNS